MKCCTILPNSPKIEAKIAVRTPKIGNRKTRVPKIITPRVSRVPLGQKTASVASVRIVRLIANLFFAREITNLILTF